MIHVVAAVAFRHGQPSEDAPVTCSCGEVVAVVDYQIHRQKVGARPPYDPERKTRAPAFRIRSDVTRRTERSGRMKGAK